jgi:hypothetical protein
MRISGLFAASALLAGCGDPGCLDAGDEACVVPSPCAGIAPQTCEGGSSLAKIVQAGDPLRPIGPAATAAAGDVLLANNWVTAVISAISHPSGLAPTGGALLDLELAGGADDGIAGVHQVTGPLPEDAVAYSRLEVIGEPGGIYAVQVTGVVVGRPLVRVATRYEIRPCEPGIRIRTEVVNGGAEPVPVAIADDWSLGGRGLSPFAPGDGGGFPTGVEVWPPNNAARVPWVGFGLRDDSAAYAEAECNGDDLAPTVGAAMTGVGHALRWLGTAEGAVFERFVAIAPGPSIAAPANLLGALLGPDRTGTVLVTGTVALADGDGSALGTGARATVTAFDEDDRPWATAVPDADGAYALRLPDRATWTLGFDAFGERVAELGIATDGAADAGTVTLPAAAALDLTVVRDGGDDWALVQVLPQVPVVAPPSPDDAPLCAPLLGSPYGGSPACNRVLVHGATRVWLPAGDWQIVATAGLLSTLDRADLTVGEGEIASVDLAVDAVPGLLPADAISADTHVHGRGSYDSALPDDDRIASLLAADLDVAVATDHDRVTAWPVPPADLRGLTWIQGVEATPQLPFARTPGAAPQVIGHWIAWPLVSVPFAAWGGAPPDEGALPGVWLKRLEDYGWAEDAGIAELAHPWAGTLLGRDLGWVSSLGSGFADSLDGIDSDSALFLDDPPATRFGNADYAVQEVLSGNETSRFAQDRAVWHALLDHAILRAATANSDSHSLLDMGPGAPRNLVPVAAADSGAISTLAFSEALRSGKGIATNGPIPTVTTTDLDGAPVSPGLTPFVADNVAMLAIRVVAAPWVPVDEVRIVVNGIVAARFDDLPPPDPTAGPNAPIVRFEQAIPLSDVLGAEDGWIVVEAGAPLRARPDTDADGIPDAPTSPPLPIGASEPQYLWWALAGGAEPVGFTGPLLVDHDGLGFVGPAER